MKRKRSSGRQAQISQITSAPEKAAIAKSVKQAAAGGPTDDLYHTGLDAGDNNYVFLLDVTEVGNGAYGYGNNVPRKKTGSIANWWWLRSPSSKNDQAAGIVENSGTLTAAYITPG